MAAPSDEFARIRSYLLAQGEKFSFLELWPRRIKARLEVLDALEDVSEEQAAFKPGENEWSISEVALHVLNGSKNVSRLVELLAQGDTASSENIDPAKEQTDLKINELRRQLLYDALNWSSMTERLPASPSFTVTANHSMFGDLHSRGWYLFQRLHDLDHAGQIRSVKESQGYPTS